jgi:hypothetical protein
MVDLSKRKLRLTGKQPEKIASGSQSRLSPLEHEKEETPKGQLSPDLSSPVAPQSPGPRLADFSDEEKAEFGVDAVSSKSKKQTKAASKVVKGKVSNKNRRKPTMLQKALGLVQKATKPFALFLKRRETLYLQVVLWQQVCLLVWLVLVGVGLAGVASLWPYLTEPGMMI